MVLSSGFRSPTSNKDLGLHAGWKGFRSPKYPSDPKWNPNLETLRSLALESLGTSANFSRFLTPPPPKNFRRLKTQNKCDKRKFSNQPSLAKQELQVKDQFFYGLVVFGPKDLIFIYLINVFCLLQLQNLYLVNKCHVLHLFSLPFCIWPEEWKNILAKMSAINLALVPALKTLKLTWRLSFALLS